MSFSIAVQRVSDGEVRVYKMETIDFGSGTHWWLTEGNYGCDCNRGNAFLRAGGEEDQDFMCAPTGTLFKILYAELPSGERVKIDPED